MSKKSSRHRDRRNWTAIGFMAESMKNDPHLFDTYASPVRHDKYLLLHWICGTCSKHHVRLVKAGAIAIFDDDPVDMIFEGIDLEIQCEQGWV